MTHLFKANIHLRIRIQDCPEDGLEALEFRRRHGLEERLDNEIKVVIQDDIPEDDFRKLVEAGTKGHINTDGSCTLYYTDLSREFDCFETSRYGHRATIRVEKEDTPIDLACRAIKSCRLEEKRAKLGIPELEKERDELSKRLNELNALIDAQYL